MPAVSMPAVSVLRNAATVMVIACLPVCGYFVCCASQVAVCYPDTDVTLKPDYALSGLQLPLHQYDTNIVYCWYVSRCATILQLLSQVYQH